MKYIIFGANSDIAYELSKILVKNNFEIILASSNIEKLKKKELFLSSIANKPIKSYCVDIQNDEQINNFFKLLNKDDYHLIICSGYLEIPESNNTKIMNINYFGPKNLIEKFVKNFQENMRKITCITSVASDRLDYKKKTYSLSKRNLSDFLNLKSKEFKKDQISIQNVKPGYVKTKMIKDINLPKILVIEPIIAAKKIFDNLHTNNENIYIPFYWKYILFLYNLLFRMKILK